MSNQFSIKVLRYDSRLDNDTPHYEEYSVDHYEGMRIWHAIDDINLKHFPTFQNSNAKIPVVERLLAMHPFIAGGRFEEVTQIQNQMIQNPFAQRAGCH